MSKGFIEHYIDYQNLRTNAPDIYGTHLAIQLLGHAMGPYSVCQIQPRAIHHNSYICLIGESGRARKSTAQNDVIKYLYPKEILGSNSFSPEGLLRELQDKSNHLISHYGELSTLLRGIISGGMANIKEISNDIFMCPEEYTKRLTDKNRSYSIKKPYLSLSSTCTEDEFFPNLNPDMVHGGFLPRWLLVYSNPPVYRPRTALPENIREIENSLTLLIRGVYNWFRDNPINFKLSSDALTAYDNICRELNDDSRWDSVQPFVVRYQNYIISYADILLLSDKIGESYLANLTKITKLTNITNPPRVALDTLASEASSVQSDYIKRAWDLIKPCLEYARNCVKYVDEDFIVKKLATVIDKKAPIAWTDAGQRSHLDKNKFKLAFETLSERDLIFSFKKTTQVRGTKIQRIICKTEYKRTPKCGNCEYEQYCQME